MRRSAPDSPWTTRRKQPYSPPRRPGRQRAERKPRKGRHTSPSRLHTFMHRVWQDLSDPFARSRTPENTPVVSDPKTGTFMVLRTARSTPVSVPVVRSESEERFHAYVEVGRAISILVLAPCLIPVLALGQQRRRYTVPPPGSGLYVTVMAFLAFVPGVLGLCGVAEFLLERLTPSIPDLPQRLPALWYPGGECFMAFLVPVWLVFLVYALRLWLSDSQAVRAVMQQRVAEEKAQQEEYRRQQAIRAQAQHDQDVAIASGTTAVIGEIMARHWNGRKEPPGWEIVPTATRQWCTVNMDHVIRHIAPIAPTGAGKTDNVARPLLALLHRQGAAAPVYDPTGDGYHPADFHLNFSMEPTEAETSIRLCLTDPLRDVRDAADMVAQTLIAENKANPFYSDESRAAFAALEIAHHLITGHFAELAQVRAYTAEAVRRTRLITRVTEIGANARDVQRRSIARDILPRLRMVDAQCKATGADTTLAGLIKMLDIFGTGRFTHFITTRPDRGVTMRYILEERLIVRFCLPVNNDHMTLLGRVMLHQYHTAILSPVIGRHYKVIVLDEASHFMDRELRVALQQARSHNAGYIAILQGIEQIDDPNDRNVTMTNFRSYFALSGIKLQSAKMLSEIFGQKELPVYTRSTRRGTTTGQSTGTSTSTGMAAQSGSSSAGLLSTFPGQSSTGRSRQSSAAHSEAHSTAENESAGESVSYPLRPLWLPSELTNLPPFHAVAHMYDGTTQSEPLLIRFLTPAERAQLPEGQHMPHVEPHRLPPIFYARTPLPDDGDELGEDRADTTKEADTAKGLHATPTGSPNTGQDTHGRVPAREAEPAAPTEPVTHQAEPEPPAIPPAPHSPLL